MSLRVAVLLSGSGSTFANLLQWQQRGDLDVEFSVVISSRADVKGCDLAREAGIPLVVVPSKEYRGQVEEFSAAITAALDAHNSQFVAMAGFMSFFTIPDKYSHCVMNVHPALIPHFSGAGMYGDRVHAAVLEAGVGETGCTVHFANNHYDEGPMVMQKKVPVKAGDTVATLGERVRAAERDIYPLAIQAFAKGEMSFAEPNFRVVE